MTETPSDILPDSLERAAEVMLRTARDARLSICTAESCTGGLLAALLTDVEGAAHAFERGFVTYSERAKCELLELAQEHIDRCGAVSRDVALAMAAGALEASPADVAWAVTGFAGRGAPGDEAGLVHFACHRRGRDAIHRCEHFGDIGRGSVRVRALAVAVSMLGEAVSA